MDTRWIGGTGRGSRATPTAGLRQETGVRGLDLSPDNRHHDLVLFFKLL